MRPILVAITLASTVLACRRPPDPPVSRNADHAAIEEPIPALAPIVENEPPPRGKHLAIVYSSNMFGEYEPCG